MEKPILYNLIDVDIDPSSKFRLRIDNLQIRKGDIHFIVGASGSGKSTLLQQLGLMDHKSSYVKDPGRFDLSLDGRESVDLKDVWNSPTKAVNFRKKYLSFIFQSPNFFNQIKAIDNVLLSQIIQGSDEDTSKKNTDLSIKKIFQERRDVSDRVLDDNVLTKDLSGGEKQRLAFARAISRNHKVLLADEPTGNLDSGNSTNLMNILVEIGYGKTHTAVIVTHDLDIACKYGNRITFLKRDSSEQSDQNQNLEQFSLINYEKEGDQWKIDSNESLINDAQLKEEIESYLEVESEDRNGEIKMISKFNGILNWRLFRNKFIIPELKHFRSYNKTRLRTMFWVTFWSLLIYGFAQGFVDLAGIHLKSPFVRTVTCNISPNTKAEASEDFKNWIADTLLKPTDFVYPYDIESYAFVDYMFSRYYLPDQDSIKEFKTVGISEGNLMFDYFFNNSENLQNRISPINNRVRLNKVGVIVSEDLIKRDNDTNKKYPTYIEYIKDSIRFKLPISMICKKLPLRSDVVMSSSLLSMLQGDNTKPLIDQYKKLDKKYISLLIHPEELDAERLNGKNSGVDEQPEKQYLTNLFKDINGLKESEVRKDFLTHINGWFMDFELDTMDSFNTMDVRAKIEEILIKENLEFTEVGNLELSLQKLKDKDYSKPEEVQQLLQIYFNNFDHLDTVSKLIESNYKFAKISYEDIHTKRAVSLTEIVLLGLSIAFLILILIFVFLYILNMISNHVDLNAKNIGTLMAFGASNQNIILTYTIVTSLSAFRVILASCIWVFIFGEIVGLSIQPLLYQSENAWLYSGYSNFYQLKYIGWLILGSMIFLPVTNFFLIRKKLSHKANEKRPIDLINH